MGHKLCVHAAFFAIAKQAALVPFACNTQIFTTYTHTLTITKYPSNRKNNKLEKEWDSMGLSIYGEVLTIKAVLWLFVFAMFVIVSMIVDDVELF